jgi:predicted nucleic acid-binding protein
VVFDTNVYVAALLEAIGGAAFARIRDRTPRTFFASVVSAELRAGAVDRAGRLAVRELVEQFDRLGRIVTPDARSWNLAGDALGSIRRASPHCGPRSRASGTTRSSPSLHGRSALRLSPAT